MRISNFSKIAFSIIALTLLFVACGNDDSTTLVYQRSTTDNVTIYVGSEAGAVERIRDSLRRNNIDAYVGSMYETYTDGTLTFEEDLLLVRLGTSMAERRNYTFEGDNLMVLSGDTWTYMGTGDKSRINIRQHYIAYVSNNTLTRMQGTAANELTITEAAALTPFGSLDNMTQPGDTLILCTRESLFE